MDFTEFGMVIDVNSEQQLKAQSPMVVTELPILIDVNP